MLSIITDASLLESLIKIDDLISFLMANNIKCAAICDKNLFASIEFYLKCQEKGIKPILGLKVKCQEKEIYLYAKNYEGYKKLLKINTLSFDKELLPEDVSDDNLKMVLPYESYELYSSFPKKNNLFLGYQNEIEKKNAYLITANVVYFNITRALQEKDTVYLKYLQDLGGNFAYDENSYFKVNLNKDDQKSILDFTFDIDIAIPFDKRYIPEYKKGINAYEYLRTLALKGLSKRLDGQLKEEYLKRIDSELKVINDMGFINYFLIVYDYVLYAKKNKIMVGPGRGSAAGSLVSYAIGITDIDPIKYDLLFARFLNPGRQKMPDIDIDFEDEKRGEVINYVKEKYGFEKVALGLTFNNYKSRLILRDLAKVLKIDNLLLEKFLKTINANKNLKSNLENSDVVKYLDLYPELRELYEIAQHLEGLKKNISTHAAGVVICSENLDEIIPIYKEKEILKTGIPMDYLEKMGLLKMDFLGLRNLTLIRKMLEKLPNLTLSKMPLDDAKVYEYLCKSDKTDLFQFESHYASRALYKLQIKNFNELAIAVALVRPGPSNQMDEYIKNKNTKNYFLHPALKPILDSTYGIMIFQEQVMQILCVIASYNENEADMIRIAISKKKDNIIIKEKENFIKRAIQNGYEENFAEDIFQKILKFAEYGFNKAHSVCYAFIVYTLAYIKVNYPNVYSIVMLEEAKSIDTQKEYLGFLKASGIKILKPSINVSGFSYKFKDNYLLLPLSIIKNLPANVISSIISKREKGFTSIFDFMLKCKDFITGNLYETLVLSGALDTFKINRQTLINNEDILFNYALMDDEKALKPLLTEYEEYDEAILRENELLYYGMYIGNHPCSIYQNVIKVNKTKEFLFKNINMALLVERVTKIKTKKGEDMAFIMASDETGEIECTLFPDALKSCPDLKNGDIILINGKSSKRYDKYQVIINNLKRKEVKK